MNRTMFTAAMLVLLGLTGCAEKTLPPEPVVVVPYSVSRENPFVKDPSLDYQFVERRGAAVTDPDYIDVLDDRHLGGEAKAVRRAQFKPDNGFGMASSAKTTSGNPSKDRSIYAKDKSVYAKDHSVYSKK